MFDNLHNVTCDKNIISHFVLYFIFCIYLYPFPSIIKTFSYLLLIVLIFVLSLYEKSMFTYFSQNFVIPCINFFNIPSSMHSFPACALDPGPKSPVTMKKLSGNFWFNRCMNGIEPPSWLKSTGLLSKASFADSLRMSSKFAG